MVPLMATGSGIKGKYGEDGRNGWGTGEKRRWDETRRQQDQLCLLWAWTETWAGTGGARIGFGGWIRSDSDSVFGSILVPMR